MYILPVPCPLKLLCYCVHSIYILFSFHPPCIFSHFNVLLKLNSVLHYNYFKATVPSYCNMMWVGLPCPKFPTLELISQKKFVTACYFRSRALGNSRMATELAFMKVVKVSSYYLR